MAHQLEPPPPIDLTAPTITRTERIVVDRTAPELFDWMMAAKLEESMGDVGSLPGVVGTTVLTPGPWGVTGARRKVHLSDGGAATEQILETIPGERWRYQVWDYTTAAAAPILYGLGDFRYAPLEGGRTELIWTYAFRLRPNGPLGLLGPLGRWLLKVAFLDRAYAVLMRETLKGMKAGAERAAQAGPARRGK
jgi:hypothetical protein